MQKILVIFLFTIIMVGCTSVEKKNAEYYKVYDAAYRVLTRNNLTVRKSLYRENTWVAISREQGDFLNKSRVKIVARVEIDEDGYPDANVVVLNQWDNSDAKVRAHPNYQSRKRWINVSRNAAMEAKIYNEIQSELGRHNLYQGKGYKPVYNEKKVYTTRQESPLIPYED